MIKKYKTIEVAYFDCGQATCNHVYKDSALTCLNQRIKAEKLTYKRTRIAIKVLTTRKSIKSLGREHGVTEQVVRRSVVLVVKILFKKLTSELKKEHGYKKTLENIVENTEYWLPKIEILQAMIDTKLDHLNELL
jgi:hypothetical protein